MLGVAAVHWRYGELAAGKSASKFSLESSTVKT